MSMPLPFAIAFPHGWRQPEPFLAAHGDRLTGLMGEALCCNGSLTRHLEKQAGHPVRVRLEGQERIPEWAAEPALWNGGPPPSSGGDVLLRNAWLELAGRDWVFAHSQVAVAGLTDADLRVIDQGEAPLGSLFLDRDDQVRRPELELALARSPELAARLGQPPEQPFWCRRSHLQVNGIFRARILEVLLSPVAG